MDDIQRHGTQQTGHGQHNTVSTKTHVRRWRLETKEHQSSNRAHITRNRQERTRPQLQTAQQAQKQCNGGENTQSYRLSSQARDRPHDKFRTAWWLDNDDVVQQDISYTTAITLNTQQNNRKRPGTHPLHKDGQHTATWITCDGLAIIISTQPTIHTASDKGKIFRTYYFGAVIALNRSRWRWHHVAFEQYSYVKINFQIDTKDHIIKHHDKKLNPKFKYIFNGPPKNSVWKIFLCYIISNK